MYIKSRRCPLYTYVLVSPDSTIYNILFLSDFSLSLSLSLSHSLTHSQVAFNRNLSWRIININHILVQGKLLFYNLYYVILFYLL